MLTAALAFFSQVDACLTDALTTSIIFIDVAGTCSILFNTLTSASEGGGKEVTSSFFLGRKEIDVDVEFKVDSSVSPLGSVSIRLRPVFATVLCMSALLGAYSLRDVPACCSIGANDEHCVVVLAF